MTDKFRETADVPVSVKVRIFCGTAPFPVEQYSLTDPNDMACWRANASTYPSAVVETIHEEMSKADAAAFRKRVAATIKQAREMGLKLRTSSPPQR